MSRHVVVLLVLFYLCSADKPVTFNNVKISGYSVFVKKFEKTIKYSNSLRENLPKNQAFDAINITEQYVPVLYENSISDLDYLDELIIEKCSLHEIRPGSFRNIPMLRRLSLKGNLIEEIQTGVFNGLQLSQIDLSQNAIKHIESTALDDLPQLLNIQLGDNLISSWNPEWFKNTPMLTRISLQNNSIEKLPPHAFVNLAGEKHYRSLKLTINLVFSYNKIKEIDEEAFADLSEINNLWLDHNLLEDFSDKLLENTVVHDLRIEGNNIRCLKGDLAQIIKAETNNLDANPYDCDCLKQLQDWTKNNSKRVDLFFSSLNCDAERIRNKMTALKRKLKALKGELESTEDIDDSVEIIKPEK